MAFSGGPLFTAIQTQAAPARGDRKDQRVLQHPRSPITATPGRLRGRGGGGLPPLHRNHRHRATGKLCSIMAGERERERDVARLNVEKRGGKGYLSPPASFVNVTTYLARPFPNHRLPTFNRAH